MNTNIKTLHLCLSPLKNEMENWIAHCQELDVIGLGHCQEEALVQLLRAIKVQWTLEDQFLPSQTPPALTFDPGQPWTRWHQEASPLAADPLHQILLQWREEHFHQSHPLNLTLNPRPFLRDDRLRMVYDLIEVLYGMNHRLVPNQKLKISSGLAEEHKIIHGEGLTDHIQAYPIPYSQTRRLNGHYVERLLHRFSMDLDMIPELIAPRVVHYRNKT